MDLNMICEGHNVSPNHVRQLLNAAGNNTKITLANAQGRPEAEIAPILQSIGSKKFSLQIDASGASENQAVSLINNANGPNIDISISSLQSFTENGIQAVFRAITSKKASISLDGSLSTEERAVFITQNRTNPNHELSISNFGSMPESVIPRVLQAARGKKLL